MLVHLYLSLFVGSPLQKFFSPPRAPFTILRSTIKIVQALYGKDPDTYLTLAHVHDNDSNRIAFEMLLKNLKRTNNQYNTKLKKIRSVFIK